jgi:hypothetical protein
MHGQQNVKINFVWSCRELAERDYQELCLTGNLKEENNQAVPKEPGKVGYIQRWVREI